MCDFSVILQNLVSPLSVSNKQVVALGCPITRPPLGDPEVIPSHAFVSIHCTQYRKTWIVGDPGEKPINRSRGVVLVVAWIEAIYLVQVLTQPVRHRTVGVLKGFQRLPAVLEGH